MVRIRLVVRLTARRLFWRRGKWEIPRARLRIVEASSTVKELVQLDLRCPCGIHAGLADIHGTTVSIYVNMFVNKGGNPPLCPLMTLTEVSIDAVDTRLHRLEYVITGNISRKDESPRASMAGGNIPGQIATLNERLARVANQSKHLKRLLHACLSPCTLATLQLIDSPLSIIEC